MVDQKDSSGKSSSVKLPEELRVALKREVNRRFDAGLDEPTFGELLTEAWQAYEASRDGQAPPISGANEQPRMAITGDTSLPQKGDIQNGGDDIRVIKESISTMTDIIRLVLIELKNLQESRHHGSTTRRNSNSSKQAERAIREANRLSEEVARGIGQGVRKVK